MWLVTVYYVMSYWSYPLKNILGDTGCHIANFLRETGILQIQFHSFIMATTRYIFLFHDNLLLRFNLTTNVSAIFLQCGPSITVSDWALILPSPLLSQLHRWHGCQKIPPKILQINLLSFCPNALSM